ncbi:hypothetical protein KSB_38010 [Ktedonobacter robiniae]|uniref:Uncharacterized protein n=1 Tax=Ktedonobacter robiniae TaxID=2778365 RepID=A0ABQ3URF1_9CHLR|nr:hypothetical protein KSB_38010 [Ktedonobacter robiniae]
MDICWEPGTQTEKCIDEGRDPIHMLYPNQSCEGRKHQYCAEQERQSTEAESSQGGTRRLCFYTGIRCGRETF